MIIAHVITRLICGGAEENTVLTCNWFAARGDTVFIVHGEEWDEAMVRALAPRVARIQISALCRDINPRRDLQALIQLRSLLQRIRPEIVHTHESKAGIIGRLAAAELSDCALVHGIHILPFVDVGPLRGVIYGLMEKAVAPLTHRFISVSAALKSTAIASRLGMAEQHHYIASGMDVARFQTARSLAPRSPGEPLTAIYLANYEPRKRHVEFMEMLARRRSEFESRLKFRFVGRGRMLPACQLFAQERQLLHFVSVEGFSPQPEQTLADADIALYCSAHEGLPRAIVQYCAAGKPIAAMALPGLDVLIRPEETGLLIPTNDFDALGDALIRLAENGDLRTRLSRGTRELDLSAWTAERMCSAIAGVYRSAMHDVESGRLPVEPWLTA